MEIERDYSNQGITSVKNGIVFSSLAGYGVELDRRTTKLDFSDNPLEEFELPELPDLERLWVRKAGLEEFPWLEGCPNLLYLSMHENGLEDILNIKSVPQLKLLDIQNCRVRSLEGLEHAAGLEMLYATYNQLESYEQISDHPNLMEAFLSGNPIKKMAALVNVDSLKTLYLAKALISKVEGLDNANSLVHLDLSNNPIGNEGLERILQYRREGKLPRLKTLLVEDCGIDWSSKHIQEVTEELNEHGVTVNNYHKYTNLKVPGYKVWKSKVGEGGTFDVFLLQKTVPVKIPREKILRDMKKLGLPDIDFSDVKLEDLIIKFLDKAEKKDAFKDATVTDVANDTVNIMGGLMGVMMMHSVLCEGKDLELESPTDEWYCLLIPKEFQHSQKYVRPSGYRMLKDIGIDALVDRSLEIHKRLSGLRGVPKFYEEIDLEIEGIDGKTRKVRCLREEGIDGQNLDSALKEYTQKIIDEQDAESVKVVGEHIVKVLDILQGIHERGVIHDDIAPNNIMVTEKGKVYVLDYSLAKTTDLSTIGYASRKYSSPELLNEGDVKASSDLWSVGVVLYQLLKGKNPVSDEPDKVIEIVSDREKYNRAEVDYENIPEPIQRVIRKATQHDASQRYQTASEFKEDLIKALG